MPSSPNRPPLRQRLFARFMAGADACSHEMYHERKTHLLGPLRGRVLEIGPGTGVNLPYLHEDVSWIGLEPNPAMHSHIEKRARELDRSIEIIDGLLDEAHVPDQSVDAVISTLVLCSVPSVDDLLQEIHRVLKPGGSFVFIEHVADRRWSCRWCVQKAMPFTPWRYFSDGCDPCRDIGPSIQNAGFAEVNMESYMQDGAGIISAINRPHVAGVARR